jgi:hypothetical protein
VDIACRASAPAAVITADAALRNGMTTRAELQQALVRQHGAHGIARAHRVVALADPRAESPLESLSRAHFAAAGLEPPELQVDLHDETGAFLGRVDFYWRAARVVGEADGLSKYADATVLRAEKLRQERIEQTGRTVVRWTWQEMERDPLAVAARIKRALQRNRSSVPAVRSDTPGDTPDSAAYGGR